MHLVKQGNGLVAMLPTIARYSKFNDADYLACMCHEIGTPLNAIVGLSHILANMDCSPQRKQECAVMLNESSAMLLGLMKNMLDASKLDAGMLHIEHVVFDLAKIVRQVVQILSPKADAKGLKLLVNVGQIPDNIIGDPLRIQQIVLNLVGNAIKFTSTGEIRLHVEALPDILGVYHACIKVTDTGIGMDAQQVMLIFEKYTQADAATSRHYGGTGLGLTISRELAQMMGGDIEVESELGRGSCFTAHLVLSPTTILAPTAAA